MAIDPKSTSRGSSDPQRLEGLPLEQSTLEGNVGPGDEPEGSDAAPAPQEIAGSMEAERDRLDWEENRVRGRGERRVIDVALIGLYVLVTVGPAVLVWWWW